MKFNRLIQKKAKTVFDVVLEQFFAKHVINVMKVYSYDQHNIDYGTSWTLTIMPKEYPQYCYRDDPWLKINIFFN